MDGQLVGGIPEQFGIIRDITERKSTERALRESAGQMRALFETAVDGVILIDGRGTVLMFNPACERLFGYFSEEVIGKNIKMLMPEPYRHEHDGYIANYLESRKPKIIGIGREVVGLRADGSTFPIDLSVGEAKHQGGGSIFVGIIRDITERRAALQALNESERSFRLLVEGVVDYALFMLDPHGYVANWNSGAERIKGYRADEIIGPAFLLLLHAGGPARRPAGASAAKGGRAGQVRGGNLARAQGRQPVLGEHRHRSYPRRGRQADRLCQDHARHHQPQTR